jgi:hypothetical protein
MVGNETVATCCPSPQESLERDQTWTRDVSGRHEDTMDQRPIKHKLTNDENVHEYHECTYDQTPRNMNLLLTKLDIQSKRMVTSPNFWVSINSH